MFWELYWHSMHLEFSGDRSKVKSRTPQFPKQLYLLCKNRGEKHPSWVRFSPMLRYRAWLNAAGANQFLDSVTPSPWEATPAWPAKVARTARTLGHLWWFLVKKSSDPRSWEVNALRRLKLMILFGWKQALWLGTAPKEHREAQGSLHLMGKSSAQVRWNRWHLTPVIANHHIRLCYASHHISARPADLNTGELLMNLSQGSQAPRRVTGLLGAPL